MKTLKIMSISTNIHRPYVYDPLMKQIHEVVKNTRIFVKINTRLTNFKIKSWMDEYNDE